MKSYVADLIWVSAICSAVFLAGCELSPKNDIPSKVYGLCGKPISTPPIQSLENLIGSTEMNWIEGTWEITSLFDSRMDLPYFTNLRLSNSGFVMKVTNLHYSGFDFAVEHCANCGAPTGVQGYRLHLKADGVSCAAEATCYPAAIDDLNFKAKCKGEGAFFDYVFYRSDSNLVIIADQTSPPSTIIYKKL